MTGTISDATAFGDKDMRNNLPRYSEQVRSAHRGLVERVTAIAERIEATPAQVALAWILAQHPSYVPIPGTTKTHRLQENIAAVDVALSAADLDQLNEASADVDLTTDRYPAKMQEWINR